jgi:hypothetical protein
MSAVLWEQDGGFEGLAVGSWTGTPRAGKAERGAEHSPMMRTRSTRMMRWIGMEWMYKVGCIYVGVNVGFKCRSIFAGGQQPFSIKPPNKQDHPSHPVPRDCVCRSPICMCGLLHGIQLFYSIIPISYNFNRVSVQF